MNNEVSWNGTPCQMVNGYRCFGEVCGLRRRGGSRMLQFSRVIKILYAT